MSVTIADINRYGASGFAVIAAVEVTVPPSSPPVPDALVKEYLRIDTDDTSQDDVIESLTAAATEAVQDYANISLITQTRRVTYGYGNFVRLPYGPVVTLTLVETQDSEGVWTTTTDYTNTGNGAIRFQVPGVYRVTYTAGFGATASTIPSTYQTAVVRHVKAHYEMREGLALDMTAVEIPGMTWQDAAQPKKKYTL